MCNQPQAHRTKNALPRVHPTNSLILEDGKVYKIQRVRQRKILSSKNPNKSAELLHACQYFVNDKKKNLKKERDIEFIQLAKSTDIPKNGTLMLANLGQNNHHQHSDDSHVNNNPQQQLSQSPNDIQRSDEKVTETPYQQQYQSNDNISQNNQDQNTHVDIDSESVNSFSSSGQSSTHTANTSPPNQIASTKPSQTYIQNQSQHHTNNHNQIVTIQDNVRVQPPAEFTTNVQDADGVTAYGDFDLKSDEEFELSQYMAREDNNISIPILKREDSPCIPDAVDEFGGAQPQQQQHIQQQQQQQQHHSNGRRQSQSQQQQQQHSQQSNQQNNQQRQQQGQHSRLPSLQGEMPDDQGDGQEEEDSPEEKKLKILIARYLAKFEPILNNMPSKDRSDELLHNFLASIHSVLPILDIESFKKKYDEFWYCGLFLQHNIEKLFRYYYSLNNNASGNGAEDGGKVVISDGVSSMQSGLNDFLYWYNKTSCLLNPSNLFEFCILLYAFFYASASSETYQLPPGQVSLLKKEVNIYYKIFQSVNSKNLNNPKTMSLEILQMNILIQSVVNLKNVDVSFGGRFSNWII
ncbi:unnamed protein product [Ambrosiozyma monospora]|uniref:Unnamed protein product n=1 Tax=Ambrosiozyma monospora TaxID=43982 RepID=A0ACB5SSF1_AMBMO|nr:unnamed protein product [Ambrosiozyma monospora]